MNIVFLGSGNAATALARLMVQKGHSILQVWSLTTLHAQELAMEVNAEVLTDFNNIHPLTDICVLAVSDDVVAQVATQLSISKKVLVHTAGSVNIDVLQSASINYGVLYPLQSLRKEMKTTAEIPFLVDGNTNEVKVMLFDFAKSLSDLVRFAADAERLQYHVAAVVVNNFTNHLYAIAEKFCKQQQLDFKLLHPLALETAQRLQTSSAFESQTGPSRRGDEETMNKHLELLEGNHQLQQLYKVISNSILEMYSKNNELRK